MATRARLLIGCVLLACGCYDVDSLLSRTGSMGDLARLDDLDRAEDLAAPADLMTDSIASDLAGLPADLPKLPCNGLGVICDDFEAGAITPPGWIASKDKGTLTITTEQPHGSVYSAHSAVPVPTMGNAFAVISDSSTLKALGDDVHLRGYFYLSGTALPSVDMRLFNVQATTASFKGLGLAVNPQGYLFQFSSVDSPTTKQLSTMAAPRDQWVCIEWHIAGARQAGQMGSATVKINGTELVEARLMNTPMLPFDNLTFGLFFLSPQVTQPAFDLYMDDVVIGNTPIGCLP